MLGYTIIGNYCSIEDEEIEMELDKEIENEIMECEEEDLIEACQDALELKKGSRNPIKYIRELVRGGIYNRKKRLP